jgi:hypothetical protein
LGYKKIGRSFFYGIIWKEKEGKKFEGKDGDPLVRKED